MKKRNLIFVFLVLTGCSSVEGYIVDKEDGRILIVNPEPITYGESKKSNEHYDAVWVSTNDKKYELGQKVKAYYNNIEESYPGQARSNRIKVLGSNKPNKADLSEQDVIKLLLSEQEELLVPAIQKINYSAESDNWDITVITDGEELYFQIEDEASRDEY
ncbi:DUF3221 domain-containing protein [Psychrobacillus sp. FSL H8-0484]|uniref:DUF3221 domain-containing protein n=1 Tax=Psychrobacillus sp. FSL H8-0484 TaxID=2921390 RepID=UPI0030F5A342